MLANKQKQGYTDSSPHPPSMAAYFFASPVDVDIQLDGEDKRKQVELKLEKERHESCPVYFDGESVVGQVKLLFQRICIVLGPLSINFGLSNL